MPDAVRDRRSPTHEHHERGVKNDSQFPQLKWSVRHGRQVAGPSCEQVPEERSFSTNVHASSFFRCAQRFQRMYHFRC